MHIYNRYVTRVAGACGFGSVVAALLCLAGILITIESVGSAWYFAVLGCLGAPATVAALCTAAAKIDACF